MNNFFTKVSPNIGLFSAIFYAVSTIIANVVSNKIFLIPWLAWGTDGGTIIYPLTFTLRDMMHKSLGKQVSRQVVIFTGLMNILLALIVYLVFALPSDPSWTNQEAYKLILLSVPRIIAGSIIAQVISELIDTEIFSKLYKIGDVKAVLVSNFISLIVDSVIFTLIAFYGSLPTSILLQIIYTNITLKFILALISSPLIRVSKRTVPESEI